eukprot:3423759-Rhodomonas_salina.3
MPPPADVMLRPGGPIRYVSTGHRQGRRKIHALCQHRTSPSGGVDRKQNPDLYFARRARFSGVSSKSQGSAAKDSEMPETSRTRGGIHRT